MRYTPFQDIQLSLLGMGNMRLPTLGEHGPIDETKAREIIEYAYGHGVNYFDTAYRYHSGQSEEVVGRVLRELPRDTWYLATKMPGHQMKLENGKLSMTGYMSGFDIHSPADVFEDQLEKCGVDYFDFYLLHNLSETAYDLYTDEDLGMVEYLLAQKRAGRIRHLGFSAHARPETIEKFLAWKDCFEFAQIQLNYLDWKLQDAGRKYEILTAHGIPVIVMEPVRGGRLASLNPGADAMLRAMRPHDSIASWAFRYLFSLPNVAVILSGMTTLEQLKDNLETVSGGQPLTPEEKDVLERAAATLYNAVPCTACRYCCEVCPQQLDIPRLLSFHNEIKAGSAGTLRFTLGAMDPDTLPAACIACGECVPLCPQGIQIPAVMRECAEEIVKLI
jgi:predicted aldo/keto reductase-like oxidoreductase